MRLSIKIPAATTLIGTLIFAAAVFSQSNGSSFTDAQQSSVDYRATPLRATMACRDLVALTDFTNSIVSAELEAATEHTPESCIVRGVIVPEVQYVAHFPTAWNGRFYMHGNGNYAGESVNSNYGVRERQTAVSNGFVAAFTNTGHDRATEPGGLWAHNALQKEIDFAFRAVHLTAVTVKQLAGNYYGKPVTHAYFDGCSTGGGQGLQAAQRFSGDFDGIVSGAPVFDFTQVTVSAWHNQMAVARTPLSAAKASLLADVVMDRFDDKDGVKDGVISDPAAIDFDPARDLPRGGVGNQGFTDAEITTLSAIYGGVLVDGQVVYPGVPIGGEPAGQSYQRGNFEPATPRSAWYGRVFPDDEGSISQRAIVDSWFSYLAWETDEADFDWTKMVLARDLPKLETMGRIFNATNADLRQFRARGGKLLVYHGWGDFGVNPLWTIDYYRRVKGATTQDMGSFFKLYLIPGMFHCRGGLNVDRFDALSTVIDWVEAGIEPHSLLGERVVNGKTVRTRPLCPYPQVARYKGRRSSDRAENFVCK